MIRKGDLIYTLHEACAILLRNIHSSVHSSMPVSKHSSKMHSASKKLGGGNGMCKGDCCCNDKSCYGPGCGQHLHFSAFILASIIVAIVFALLITVYEVSESRFTDMSAAVVNLQQRAWVLEHHVLPSAQSAAPKSPVQDLSLLPVVSLAQAMPADGRSAMSTPSGNCSVSTMGSVTELVTYENRTAGITLAVPYNPAWGNDVAYMTPYDQASSGISFGGNTASQGCRSFQMDIVPHVTADAIQKNALSSVGSQNVTVKTIGDWQVVETHSNTDLCASVSLEAIGRVHNFRFSSNCDDSQNAVNTLTNVIESMHRLQY